MATSKNRNTKNSSLAARQAATAIDGEEFVAMLKQALPPVIARKEVGRFLGGMVATKTLANADSAGQGPAVAYNVGRNVVYRTDSLLDWVVAHYGVKRIAGISNL